MNKFLPPKLLILLVALIILLGLVLVAFKLLREESIPEDKQVVQSETTTPRVQQSPKSIDTYTTPLQIGDTKLFVEIMNTPEKQAQGLSNRPMLKSDQGMLFDFRQTKTTRPTFWMKDMLFDIDIIWIKNLTIVEITKNVPAPADNTPTQNLIRYTPQQQSDMVLEVRSGWSEENQIKVGDKISF